MVAKGVGRQEVRMNMGGMKEHGFGTPESGLSWFVDFQMPLSCQFIVN